MSIATRLPEADPTGTPAYEAIVKVPRRGGEATDMPRPSEVLLPADGAPARDPAPAPAKALALDALRLLMAFAGPRPRGIPFSDPGFRAEVEIVWRQLAPLRSRQALADSFGREAAQRGRAVTDADLSPLRLAYAFRWLELRPHDSLEAHDDRVVTLASLSTIQQAADRR